MIPMPISRPPRHPGRILAEDFFPRLPAGTRQAELADRLRISRPRLNELIHAARAVTPDTALRLARLFGTTPEFWMSAQAAWDLHRARAERKRMRDVERIQPLPGGGPAPARREEAAEPPETALPLGLAAELSLLRDERLRDEAQGTAAYFTDFLRERGLLAEAQRWMRIQSQLDRLEPESPAAQRRLPRAARIPVAAILPPPPVRGER